MPDAVADEIRIDFEPRGDGSVLFRVHRPDGTTAWQKHERNRAGFFVLHDLSHYAIETVLNARDGFFGLLASGWDVEDTTGKGTKGPLPSEAIVVEHIVGLMDTERSGATGPYTAQEVMDQLQVCKESGRLAFVPNVSEAQLREIRSRCQQLSVEWARHSSEGSRFTLRFARPPVTGLI